MGEYAPSAANRPLFYYTLLGSLLDAFGNAIADRLSPKLRASAALLGDAFDRPREAALLAFDQFVPSNWTFGRISGGRGRPATSTGGNKPAFTRTRASLDANRIPFFVLLSSANGDLACALWDSAWRLRRGFIPREALVCCFRRSGTSEQARRGFTAIASRTRGGAAAAERPHYKRRHQSWRADYCISGKRRGAGSPRREDPATGDPFEGNVAVPGGWRSASLLSRSRRDAGPARSATTVASNSE